MKIKAFASLLATVACFSSTAMAEAPGSQAANHCAMSMSNTAYEVWPGVPALKVGRLVNAGAKIQLLTSNINEIYALCYGAGWSLSNGAQPAGHSFRAAPSAFPGGVPVMRMRHKTKGQFFFTSNQAEYDNLLNYQSATWQPEGVAFYVPKPPGATRGVQDYPLTCLTLPPGSLLKNCLVSRPVAGTGIVPVYRFYSAVNGHLYSANDQEAAEIDRNKATNGYNFEGVAFWAFAPQAMVESPILPSWWPNP